jgi:hypothetical protein
LAFGEEEFLAALAMADLEAFFNKLLRKVPNVQHDTAIPSEA